MENSLDILSCNCAHVGCMCMDGVWWMGTLVELELKNPVGLLRVE